MKSDRITGGHFLNFLRITSLFEGIIMKSSFRFSIFILMIAVLISYCSEDKNPLPSVSHPEGWQNVASEDFHGSKVLVTGNQACKSCHGTDFTGGKSKVSCYSSNCHTIYPHKESWMLIGEADFHGSYVDAHADALNKCKDCHGSDLKGGTTGISCFDCHPEGTIP